MGSTKAERGAVRTVLIGAGNRGREVYGSWIARNQDRMRLVAVADPDPQRRAMAAKEHGLPAEACFASWRDLLDAARLGKVEAEACLVCTQDAKHVEPALAALEAGWHVLLEKPMATSPEDCSRLVEAAEAAAGGEGRQLRVCHVVRYTPFFQALKRALDSGAIGVPVHIAHSENVSYWHFGHSYVRGAWGRAGDSTPVVLAKTCHDLDILYWLAGRPAKSVSSVGSLTWFRRENAPAGAPERCGPACPEFRRCNWNVESLYGSGERILSVSSRAGNPFVRLAGRALVGGVKAARSLGLGLGEWKSWPATVLPGEPTREAKAKALAEGQYGRCVFACDNDQVDHQVVSIEFEGGLTATMTMEGLSNLDGRWIRIDGSKGTLEGRFTYAGERLELWEHGSMRHRVLYKAGLSGDPHGGGDQGLLASFADSLRSASGAEPLTSGRASLESHLMGFAAERSRLERRVVDLAELR